MIYSLVVGYCTLHISSTDMTDKKFESSICQGLPYDASDGERANHYDMDLEEWQLYMDGMEPEPRRNYDECDWASTHYKCFIAGNSVPRSAYSSIRPWPHRKYHRVVIDRNAWALPSLLFTCRQVYAEARLIPYENITFNLTDTTAFGEWMQRLSPGQVAAVRSLCLGGHQNPQNLARMWATEIGYMLGRLRGTRKINVQLKNNGCYIYPEGWPGRWEEHYDLSPFRHLALGTATLHVRQAWQIVGTFTATQGAPVRSITASDLWN